MKKLLLFAALVLGAVSCMKDQTFDANVGGETDVVLSVALPADVTRAMDNDSAKGAIGNISLAEYDIRYILEVFDASNTLAKRVENYEDTATSTTFELRLIPGRHYTFVVWADFVAQGTEDALHYIAEDLRNIEINGVQNAMDESRDAYTGIFRTSDNGGQPFSSSSQISFELKRPFAKLRVVTNDMNEIYSSLVGATIVYTAETYQKYDALTKQSSELTTVSKTVDYTSEAYKYASEHTADGKTVEGKQTLFADYILGTQNGTVQFIMTVEDSVQELPAINFNTAIPVQTNYLTTIYGPILTDYNNVTVTINPAFENQNNPEDAPYYQVAVTNGVELIKALLAGQEIIVLNDITVTAADLAEATRAGEAINPVINLNGCTITIENNNTEALVNLNGGTLTVQGEGAIESTTGALVETIYNVGEATIAENAATESVVNCLPEIRAAFANGGEYTMVCDLAISESLTLATGKELVFNLNGKTLTGTDAITGSFGLITNKGNLTVKNGTMTLKAENNRGWNAYSSVISNTVGGNLVVENVTIEHFGGTDMAYGIDNLTNGKGTSAIATVNEGAVVKSTYRAIRQFLNGIEATNELTVNAGAVVEGANKSIWMQDPSANANTGKLVVNEGATLNGDVYLYVCAGSTEWPVEVSIAASAVNGEVLTGNVPAGYAVVNENGVWVVKAYEVVANGLYKKDAKTYLVMNADGLVALSNRTIKGSEVVELGADIDLTDVEFNGLSAFNPETPNTFDGKGYTVSNWTYKGGASDMGFIRNWTGPVKNVKFENCKLKTAGRSAVVAAKIYGNIENVSVNNCSIEDSYWACGIIAGLYNAGSVSNCTVTNSSVKSNGGTAAIVGVFNEEGGERGLKNCSVSNTTINNTGVYGEAYSGGALVGMFNVNTTFTIEGCAVSNNTLEGGYVYEKYPADESVTIIEK